MVQIDFLDCLCDLNTVVAQLKLLMWPDHEIQVILMKSLNLNTTHTIRKNHPCCL